jgi:hypothetical protein
LGFHGVNVFQQDSRNESIVVTLVDTEAGGSSYVANATGGQVSMSNDLMAPLREAAVEASAYYLIGFQPSAGDPGERTLKVRVRRDGLRVRAPEHYFVGGPTPAAAASVTTSLTSAQSSCVRW